MSGTTFANDGIPLEAEYRITHLSYALLKILQADVTALPYFSGSSTSIGTWALLVYKRILSDIAEVEKDATPNLASFRSYSLARSELEASLCDLVTAIVSKTERVLIIAIHNYLEKLTKLFQEQPSAAPYRYQVFHSEDDFSNIKRIFQSEKREYLRKIFQIIIDRISTDEDLKSFDFIGQLQELSKDFQEGAKQKIEDLRINSAVIQLTEIHWNLNGPLTEKEKTIVIQVIKILNTGNTDTTDGHFGEPVPTNTGAKVMSDILKLVARVSMQYAEQTTTLAQFCIEFYQARSKRTDTSKDQDFTNVVSLARLAIIKAKDSFTKLEDNEDEASPVKQSMESAIALMKTHAASYEIVDSFDARFKEAREKDKHRLAHCREKIKDRISSLGI